MALLNNAMPREASRGIDLWIPFIILLAGMMMVGVYCLF